MNCLVTGLNGTLAPHVAQAVQAAGGRVVGWDRKLVDPEDANATADWLALQTPSAIVHLAMGSPAWAAGLARYAAEREIPFLFTSTAMVFHHQPDGPHAVGDERSAQDDYGRYKAQCEDAVLAANPAAMIVRIGWQIDALQPGNNMLMALDGWQQRDGHVAASRAWRPACSYMADTAAALARLLVQPLPGGVQHFDSNAGEGHTFDQIAGALKVAFGRSAWKIQPHDDYRHDQRLVGGSLVAPPLGSRLPQLGSQTTRRSHDEHPPRQSN